MSAIDAARPPVVARGWASGHPVARFLASRVLLGALTLFIVSVVVFAAVNALPGDVAQAVLGRNATASSVATLNHQLGLDRPMLSQYFTWIGNVLQGDFGNSAAAIAQGAPDPRVWATISDPLVNTLILAGITVVLLIPMSLLLGVFLARHAGRPADLVAGGVTLVFSALPEFVLGAFLVVVFFAWLDVLPPTSLVAPGTSPLSTPDILILPVLTLLLTNLAWTTRLVRAGMVEQLRTGWIEAARLNGLTESFVVWRYALRNALAPSVQVFTLAAMYLFGGVVLTEAVFSYPGLGTVFVTAVEARDATTVSAIALIIACAYIAMNIVADLIVMLLVPKLRTAS